MQRLDIYSPELVRTASIFSWISLVWTDSYNEGGSFQLELVPEADSFALLQPDSFIRYSETGSMMVIESIQLEDDTILVTGSDAAHILANRVTIEPIEAEEAGTAEEAIRSAFNTYKGSWDILDPGTAAGLTETFAADQKPAELESIIQAIAQEADIGYRLQPDTANRKLVLECYAPGENRNAVFAPKYRNMGDIAYTVSYKNYKNVCTVITGTDFNHYTVRATVGATDTTGHERREMLLYGDGDDIYWEEQGLRALAQQADIETVDCTITDGAALGDIISIRLPDFGVNVKKRVTQIRHIAQSGKLEKNYTIGTIIKGVS